MNILAILAMVDAALVLLQKLPAALDALKRSEELSPEMEKALDEKIRALRLESHWRI